MGILTDNLIDVILNISYISRDITKLKKLLHRDNNLNNIQICGISLRRYRIKILWNMVD